MSLIGIDLQDPGVANKLGKLGNILADEGVEKANEAAIFVVRVYAPSHSGEPFIWSSPAQRRAAFAKMREQGGPPYSRTQTLYEGWETVGSGKTQVVVNRVPYAKFVKAPPIVGHAAREWTSVSEDLDGRSNLRKVVDGFLEGVKRAFGIAGL